MEEEYCRQQDEDSEEENWTDVWDDLSCNLKPASITCAARSTNHKLKTVMAMPANGNDSQVNEIASTTKSTSESASESTIQSTSESTSQPSFLRMGLNDNKAGMEGLDKGHINKVIMEASRGSKFYASQLKKEAVMQRRINEQERRMELLSDAQIEEGTREADRLLADLEAGRDLTRTIVHIDMDAFYAAVEMRDNPALRTQPMAVGGTSMLSTSNYLARRYGVRAAMPGFIAKKLCPTLTIVPCNFDKYIAVSKDIREIMSEYDPNLCPMSLDEAYLDLTEHLEKRKDVSEKDRTFCKRVDPSLLCSCGEVKDDGIVLAAPEVLKTHDIKTIAVADKEQEKESEAADMDIKLSGLHEGTLETETLNNADTLQVSRGDDKRQNWKQEIERETDQNDNIDSANRIDKEIEKRTNQTVNLDSANGIHTSEKVMKESRRYLGGSLPHVCAECGKPRDPSLLAEKVTFGTSVEDAVNEMRFRIEATTQLTASAGIAPNTMLAKVCSDKNKPNGQYTIASSKEAVMTFINDLPLKKVVELWQSRNNSPVVEVCGIGKVSEQMLSALGVVTCHDLYLKRGLLFHLYSTTSFHHFMQICAGIGSTRVERDGERKSISVERTFPALCRPAELYKKCYELSEKLTEDLKEEAIMGKTVTLKLKTVKFETMTRAQSLLNPTSDLEQIYSTARDLLRAEMQNSAPEPLHLRLMGVRMSNLCKSQQTQPKQETILGCFRKIQPKGLQLHDVGESRNKVDQDITSTARQGILRHVSLGGGYSDVGGSQECHSCNSAITQNQKMFSKQGVIKPGKEAHGTLTESSVDLVEANKDLLNRGLNVRDLWHTPSEDVQKEFDEISSRWNTSVDNAHFHSQQDGARCGGGVSIGRDTAHISQDVSVDSMSHYSKQPGSSQQRSVAENQVADILTCPVCDIPQICCDLADFNNHVDSCLSKRAVRELLEADKKGQNSASCSKRLTEEGNEKRGAKRKRSTLTPGLEKHHNIQRFFKGGPN